MDETGIATESNAASAKNLFRRHKATNRDGIVKSQLRYDTVQGVSIRLGCRSGDGGLF